MKIPASLRTIYADRRPVYQRLMAEVDDRARSLKKARWHYESRLKSEESYALKVETGRVQDPLAMEDFFAATFVVPTISDVLEAEDQLCKHFALSERRPKKKDATHKSPDNFQFDDLRLYVSIASDPRYPGKGVEGITFEIQVKTFLQHAWAIATHDLTYKSDDVSWPMERIAFQVKAMLEHAEVSIDEARALSKSKVISKTNSDTKSVIKIIELIKDVWKTEAPSDIKRLATNLVELGSALSLRATDVDRIVRSSVAAAGGQAPLNISPYMAVLQAVANEQPERVRDYLYSRPPARERFKRLCITPELQLPASIERTKILRAVVIA